MQSDQGHLYYIVLKGDSFGEIALLTNQTRTATLICRQDSYLMTLSKQAFEGIMGKYNEYVTKDRLIFLQQFNFFKQGK
ncbi:hypothetical protein IMG5_169820 [Ichthyophthirius multifiliis]|uniref:Cyclic nucleotide-binding domain-containing protein n=1 Tax=Ichthyophthirius multifiliis TaxID=5932 RepID=G0R1D4_ICHMU|nr:hypothetical protein IMG5_169820 [Ichthyophthirius multifiliis]EGR28719.1 hypothetical protein IMG5_169820 [Ichthyophthirius multifiliis]|eukprot:XP_004029955.1 hypothetical protein IMG5_169820 [Ichthyophthirius multifiliis]